MSPAGGIFSLQARALSSSGSLIRPEEEKEVCLLSLQVPLAPVGDYEVIHRVNEEKVKISTLPF
ncbi:MAG TPA: hypothetical protein PLH24_03115 [Candidatus Atribacteria bacterium]|nr:hypothetical protein [Candidatus Atribacteria bacterium]